MKTTEELSGGDRIEYDHLSGQYALIAEGEHIPLGDYTQAMQFFSGAAEALTKIDAFLGEGKAA